MDSSTDAETALRRRTWVAAGAVAAGVVLAGGAIWTQRPRLEPIEPAQQTTYILTPTRGDGWVWGISVLAMMNVASYWIFIPYRTQQRFMLQAVGLAVVTAGALFTAEDLVT